LGGNATRDTKKSNEPLEEGVLLAKKIGRSFRHQTRKEKREVEKTNVAKRVGPEDLGKVGKKGTQWKLVTMGVLTGGANNRMRKGDC